MKRLSHGRCILSGNQMSGGFIFKYIQKTWESREQVKPKALGTADVHAGVPLFFHLKNTTIGIGHSRVARLSLPKSATSQLYSFERLLEFWIPIHMERLKHVETTRLTCWYPVVSRNLTNDGRRESFQNGTGVAFAPEPCWVALAPEWSAMKWVQGRMWPSFRGECDLRFCVAGAIVSEPQKDFFHPRESYSRAMRRSSSHFNQLPGHYGCYGVPLLRCNTHFEQLGRHFGCYVPTAISIN